MTTFDYSYRTGSRKFRCVDCGNIQFLKSWEAAKKVRPHCYSCGSTFWEAHSSGAKESVLKAATMILQLGWVQVAIERLVKEHNISITEWNLRTERVERILGHLLRQRDGITA